MDVIAAENRDWMKAKLVEVLRRRPDLTEKVVSLFWGQFAVHKPGAVFDYFFRVVPGETAEAGYPVAMLALREDDEITAALAALENSQPAHPVSSVLCE